MSMTLILILLLSVIIGSFLSVCVYRIPFVRVDPSEPGNAQRWKRIDYAFTSASLAGAIASYRVDRSAVGSDHLPIWLELKAQP